MTLRVAFTFAGGAAHWTGGLNYLCNAFRVLRQHHSAIVPVLFVAPSVTSLDVAALQLELDSRIEPALWLDAASRRRRLARALLSGVDDSALQAFRASSIDVVFEAGEYFGHAFPIPAVTWIADFQSHQLPEFSRWHDRWKTYLGRRLQMMGRRLVLLSSEHAQRDCWHLYPASRDRTVVVPFASQPRRKELPDADLQRKYGLPDRFLYLPNQFWKHKNHGLMIEALAMARREVADMVIAASGSPADYRHPGHYTALQARVTELRLQDCFRFLGLIPRDDVQGLMELSVAVVNPSLFEGWSTTVEEAKALGVPLVLSALDVHFEQAGDTATYFAATSIPEASCALIKAWGRSLESPLTRRSRALPENALRTAEFARRLDAAFHFARALPRGAVER